MIEIYHNVLTHEEQSELEKIFNKPKWAYSGISNFNPKRTFWYMELFDEPFITDHFFIKIKKIIDKDVRIARVYANGQTHGLDGEFHQDGDSCDDITFLYYYTPSISSEEILEDYGGHTQFKIPEDNHTMIYSFEPRHNTAVLFPGTLFHRGLSPSSREYGLRITIAFKLKEIKSVRNGT